MPNPLQKLVELVKSGDKRVLIGGAVVIGGGAGLFVYLRRKQSSGGVDAIPSPSMAPGGDSGGGGGGGGGSDLSGLGDLGLSLPSLGDTGLPTLSDPFAATAPLLDSPFQPSSLAGVDLPSLPDLASSLLPTASPFGGYGALPSLGPTSYTGPSYGNDIGANPQTPVGSASDATRSNNPAVAAPPSRAENISAAIHSPVTPAVTNIDTGLVHNIVQPSNAGLQHTAPAATNAGLQHATAAIDQAQRQAADTAQRQAAQVAAERQAAETAQRQAAQQVADYQAGVQAQIRDAQAAAVHAADAQRQAAFASYQATVAALIHQQQSGQRGEYTLAGQPGGNSLMVSPHEISQVATAAVIHQTQATEQQRMAAQAPNAAPAVHAPAPAAPAVHAPTTTGKRS